MIFKRAVAKLRAQDWAAISIELVILVVGVFIGTAVANWNEQRLERAETRKMLAQLVPELRSQIEFFDTTKIYYATSRSYADQAFAGWKRDPRISDEQFVIAAYQASQITGIAINPDSWSLTFGGGQLRNIDDPKIRRNLELALTADYAPVEIAAVATPYREKVRRVIPIEIQDRIRVACGDRSVRGKEEAFYVTLRPTCPLKIDPALAARTATDLRARPDLVGELDWHLAAVAAFLGNAELLATPLRDLQRRLDTET